MKLLKWVAVVAVATTAAPLAIDCEIRIGGTADEKYISNDAVEGPAPKRLNKRIVIIATNAGLGIGSIIFNSVGSGASSSLSSAATSIMNIFRGGSAPAATPTDLNASGLVATLREQALKPHTGILNSIGSTIGQSIGGEIGGLLTLGTQGTDSFSGALENVYGSLPSFSSLGGKKPTTTSPKPSAGSKSE